MSLFESIKHKERVLICGVKKITEKKIKHIEGGTIWLSESDSIILNKILLNNQFKEKIEENIYVPFENSPSLNAWIPYSELMEKLSKSLIGREILNKIRAWKELGVDMVDIEWKREIKN
jgi:hypothetical protein